MLSGILKNMIQSGGKQQNNLQIFGFGSNLSPSPSFRKVPQAIQPQTGQRAIFPFLTERRQACEGSHPQNKATGARFPAATFLHRRGGRGRPRPTSAFPTLAASALGSLWRPSITLWVVRENAAPLQGVPIRSPSVSQ